MVLLSLTSSLTVSALSREMWSILSGGFNCRSQKDKPSLVLPPEPNHVYWELTLLYNCTNHCHKKVIPSTIDDMGNEET